MPVHRSHDRQGGPATKTIRLFLTTALILLAAAAGAHAGGPFGPPQPVVKGAQGLHTGIGYWFHEDRYGDGADLLIRQNQIYSEVGYGSRKGWEVYGRIGVSDLKAIDAFRSSSASTTTERNDFQEHWKFFGTIGAKGFYPFNGTFGLGAFVQGSYHFSDFTDSVSGNRGGAPFRVDMRVKNLWDVNAGIGLQATLPRAIRIYAGPYVGYSECRVTPSATVPGLAFTSEERSLNNRTRFGGYSGIDIPLARGFSLGVEGQYSERMSAGAVITYTY